MMPTYTYTITFISTYAFTAAGTEEDKGEYYKILKQKHAVQTCR